MTNLIKLSYPLPEEHRVPAVADFSLGNVIDLRWEDSPRDLRYEVFLKYGAGSIDFQTDTPVHVGTNPWYRSTRTAGTAYAYAVRVVVRPSTLAFAPSVADPLTVDSIGVSSGTAALLGTTPVAGAASYQFSALSEDQSYVAVTNPPVTTAFDTINGLTPGTLYWFEVKVFNSGSELIYRATRPGVALAFLTTETFYEGASTELSTGSPVPATLTRSGTTATFTTAKSFSVYPGATITVANAGAPFDGDFIVTNVNANSLTYVVPNSGSTSAIPGAFSVVQRTKAFKSWNLYRWRSVLHPYMSSGDAQIVPSDPKAYKNGGGETVTQLPVDLSKVTGDISGFGKYLVQPSNAVLDSATGLPETQVVLCNAAGDVAQFLVSSPAWTATSNQYSITNGSLDSRTYRPMFLGYGVDDHTNYTYGPDGLFRLSVSGVNGASLPYWKLNRTGSEVWDALPFPTYRATISVGGLTKDLGAPIPMISSGYVIWVSYAHQRFYVIHKSGSHQFSATFASAGITGYSGLPGDQDMIYFVDGNKKFHMSSRTGSWSSSGWSISVNYRLGTVTATAVARYSQTYFSTEEALGNRIPVCGYLTPTDLVLQSQVLFAAPASGTNLWSFYFSSNPVQTTNINSSLTSASYNHGISHGSSQACTPAANLLNHIRSDGSVLALDAGHDQPAMFARLLDAYGISQPSFSDDAVWGQSTALVVLPELVPYLAQPVSE